MKRVSNNIKFYVFIDILRTYSDNNVSLSIKEIQHHMEKRLGVMVDRRTIYSYIKDMRALGMNVSDYDKNKEGYYLSSNHFEADEVRILADAVLTSSFITRSKTEELLEKLKSFNSIYQNKDFSRAVFVEDIPKSINEEVFENLMKIYQAIRLDRKVIFNYCDYDYYNNLVGRVDDEGKPKIYKVDPIYIVLRDGSYYFACMDNDSEETSFKNFRIDRMINVSVVNDEEIADLEQVNRYRLAFNNAEYLNKNVKTTPGRDIMVVVEFKQKMLNYILDKFGDYIYIMEKDNYKNNNLGEETREESLHFQILYKIFGKRDYDEYILSGRYIENSETREKFEDFKKMLDKFIQNTINLDNLNACNSHIDNSRIDSRSDGDSCIDSGLSDDAQKTMLNEGQKEKKYIGIFIAKESPKLARWLMQFGTDMRVIWPQTLKNIVIDEIDKLKQFYM